MERVTQDWTACVEQGISYEVARIGGDEFVVVCPDVAGRGDVNLIAAKIRELIKQPIDLPVPLDSGQLSSVAVSVGASIGMAFGVAGDESEPLLREAHRAIYVAKDPVRTPLSPVPERLDRAVL